MLGTVAECREVNPFRHSVVAALWFILITAGCSEPLPPGDTRAFRSLDDFSAAYWDRPIPAQGSAASGDALDPGSCGSCHALQLQDWQTTLHSRAYSPGLEGQLVWWEEADYASVRQCLVCHAPISEQSALVPDPSSGKLVKNSGFDRKLQRQGVICAACHMRGGQIHGPPLRNGSTPAPIEGAPHGGSIRTEYFERSEFCASCHQFEEPSANGKSLQNTHREWQESRYPAEGKTCQSCHMPDRRHLWRGIHDSTMTSSGVTITLDRISGNRITLRIINTGTGHYFPTYVTPKIVVQLEQLDADGMRVDGGMSEGTIGRVVQGTAAGWVEHSDTRIPPDSAFEVTASLLPGTHSIRGRVTVFPDGFYDAMFAGLLAGPLSDTSRALLTKARQITGSSSYRIFDKTVSGVGPEYLID